MALQPVRTRVETRIMGDGGFGEGVTVGRERGVAGLGDAPGAPFSAALPPGAHTEQVVGVRVQTPGTLQRSINTYITSLCTYRNNSNPFCQIPQPLTRNKEAIPASLRHIQPIRQSQFSNSAPAVRSSPVQLDLQCLLGEAPELVLLLPDSTANGNLA
ncbi:hypothetical protein JZ751_013275 [Albula glossodonta]|uniref:Uncharacterized protein n=1 Tax=Albula glossodonta TaxID=121402 RepID=A0A8T2P2N7_9TELE|nr:hypothetical protein JZ751_013275 [Albula glossodonta]